MNTQQQGGKGGQMAKPGVPNTVPTQTAGTPAAGGKGGQAAQQAPTPVGANAAYADKSWQSPEMQQSVQNMNTPGPFEGDTSWQSPEMQQSVQNMNNGGPTPAQLAGPPQAVKDAMAAAGNPWVPPTQTPQQAYNQQAQATPGAPVGANAAYADKSWQSPEMQQSVQNMNNGGPTAAQLAGPPQSVKDAMAAAGNPWVPPTGGTSPTGNPGFNPRGGK